jgi:hypothetical protein
MKKSAQSILGLITREGQPDMALDCGKLTQVYAHQIAAISHKINRDELAILIAVGVGIYQRGLKEFQAGADAEDLFNAVQQQAAQQKQ